MGTITRKSGHNGPIYNNMVSYMFVRMGTQISLKLSDRMYESARKYAEVKGFDTLQDLIRELLRERLFEREPETVGGLSTYLASEESLARNWQTPEED